MTTSPSAKEIYPDIFKIQLPFPGDKPGPINVYLFRGECITLVDTGIPRTVKFLKKALDEIGIDSSQQYAKPLSKYAGKKDFDYLITVCGNADERCPVFPGVGTRLHWPFEDPAAFEGSDGEITAKFREIRNQINEKITSWLKQYITDQ